jgi:hypothetical protein
MTLWESFLEHPVFWSAVFLLPLWGIAELIVALTPTKKDDSALKMFRNFIFALINLIPRLKKGGGTFNKK